MVNDNFKHVTHIDLGWSEDTYNNFLIDLWECYNKKSPQNPTMYQYFDAITGEVHESETPITCTVALKKSNK